MYKKLCLFFCCLLTLRQAVATTYYVDSRRGNDQHQGTSKGQPLKSLEKVNALSLGPGDAVLFRKGTTYQGQLKITGRGQPGKLICFSSYGSGDKPRIDGKGEHPETVLIYNAEYLKFDGFEITNQGAERKPHRMGLHIQLQDFGIAHQVHIANLYVHDVNGSNVKQQGGGAGIHWTNRGQQIKSAFDGLLIENCKIERTDRNGITSSGYANRNNWFPSRNVVIRHNYLNDIGGDGIVPIGCEGALIEYNVLYRGGQRFPQGDAAAGIWPWSCDNTLVQYNEVAYYGGPWDSQGFDSDWNCHNSVFQYNYSHDNDGGFMLVCSPTQGNQDGNNGTIIRYNISQNDGKRIKWAAAGFSPVFHITGPVKNTHIYNNIIYLDRKRDPREDTDIIKFDTWGGGWPDSTFFTNNIFYAADTASYSYGKSTNHFFTNNLYYGKLVNAPQDDHAIYAEPGFVTGGQGRQGRKTLQGYRLKPASPAINKGKVITGIMQDFFGEPIPLRPASYHIGVDQ
jgi:hypothetical protein